MEGAGGEGDNDGNEAAASKPTHKRSKSRSKVWEKVAWFTRRSRARDGSADGVVLPELDSNGLPMDQCDDLDLSPSASDPCLHFESCSPSSSDSEIVEEFTEGIRIKRSRLYPNSEIIEQSCLKPSVARALFLQMEAANLRGGSKPVKYAWQKKKRKAASSNERSGSLSFDIPQPKDPEDTLSRTMSVPAAMSRSQCHCPACCTCTPAQRLMGLCPAHARLSASTASLDTGLSRTEQIEELGCIHPLAINEPIKPSDESETPSASSLLQVSDQDNQYKANSLPMWYGRRCRGCHRPAYRSHLPRWHHHPPDLDVCQCAGKKVRCTRPPHSKLVTEGPCQINISHDKDVVQCTEFRERRELMKSWFSEFTDEQRNLLIKDILEASELPQIHLLSLEMGPRLHEGCPPNCQDILIWLPQSLALAILGCLDPVSLSRASCVCRSWYTLANDATLWRRFCCQPKWRLSRTGEQKQLLQHMLPNGSIHWKLVFAERYRLRNNWLRGKCYVRTFEGHTQGISCVQFDDTRIVSGSTDKTIKVWNIRTNSPWSVQTLVGHSGTVRCLHLQGNRLVSGSTDRTIKVWDLSTQQSWSSIACKVTMVGHQDTVRCLQVDDEKVISGSYDTTLKVWHIRTGNCIMTLRGHAAAVLCVQFDENKIVSGSCDKTIKVWTFTGECLMTLHGHHDAVTCLQFDATRIISGSLDCNLKFWDVHTGACSNTIDWKASEGHTGVVRCLQADSWRVVSASDDRTLKVWSLETGERLVTLRNHTDGVTCLQFNDSIIVSGSYDKTVKLWDFSCC